MINKFKLVKKILALHRYTLRSVVGEENRTDWIKCNSLESQKKNHDGVSIWRSHSNIDCTLFKIFSCCFCAANPQTQEKNIPHSIPKCPF